MVAFSRDLQSEVAEKVEKLRSIQSIALEKFDPKFSLICDVDASQILITTDLDIEFVFRSENFSISTHTLILGKHYLLGPTINFVTVNKETDFGLLSELLSRIDSIRALDWSNWLCTCLGISRLIESDFANAGLSLESKTKNMVEIMAVLSRSIGILRNAPGLAPIYAETLASDFERYVEEHRSAEEPKFMGYNPFYDLRTLGKKQFQLRVDRCHLGCQVDQIAWEDLIGS